MVDEVEAGDAEKDEQEAKQRPELPDASPEPQEFSLQFGAIEIEDVETYDLVLVSSEPSNDSGPGNAEVCGDASVSGSANELPEAMVVGSCLSHPSILGRAAGSSMARGCRRRFGAEQSRSRPFFSRIRWLTARRFGFVPCS